MDYSQDYYGMELWKQMLGLSGNPYVQPPMQYPGMNKEEEKKKQGGGSNMNTQMMQSLLGGGTTATGMTPNATNAMGESYYGWGAQTGDWGAAGSAAPVSGSSGLVAGAEIPSAGMTYGASGAPTAEMAGMGSIGGEAGGAASIGSYASTLGYVGAGLAGLHQMTQMNNRSFEGQATKDIFGGSYATDPWVPTFYQKLGIKSPSAGESFDAQWQNSSNKGMAQTLPRAMGYWVNPATSMGYDVVSDKFGKTAASILFPDQWGLKQLGSLFGKLF
jgi:hypothetical protein